MNRNKRVHCVLCLAISLTAASVQAQSGDAGEPSVSSAPSAKEIRAADRILRKAVLRGLSRTKGLNVDCVVIVAKAGSILLEGYVRDGDQIDLATSVAEAVPGVTTVTNGLIVRAEGL